MKTHRIAHMIIAFIILCLAQNQSAKCEDIWGGEDRSLDMELHNGLWSSILLNVELEIYFLDYNYFTIMHATNCGLLQVEDHDMVEINYSFFGRIAFSAWHAKGNWLRTETETANVWEEHLDNIRSDFNESGLQDRIEFDEYYKLWVLEYFLHGYTNWICTGYSYDTQMAGTDIEEILNNIGEYWGVTINTTKFDKDLRVEYEYSSQSYVTAIYDNTVAQSMGPGLIIRIYYDDIEIYNWWTQIHEDAMGDWRDEDEVIRGEIQF